MCLDRILIADNDEEYAKEIKDYLEHLGYSVVTASNESDARRILEKEQVSLAVIDLRLADDSDDFDWSGIILAKETNPEIPKIILTAFSSIETIRAALKPTSQGKSPAMDFIDKYQGIEPLLTSIRSLTAQFTPSRPLQVFLCHSSTDKTIVRNLCNRLEADGIHPWLDEKELLPGQEWEQEIPKAVRKSDIVIVCLSRGAISKRGYVQREIRIALNAAEEQPEGAIFLIPLRLEECDVPDRLKRWQWVDYFKQDGYERLLRSLRHRASEIGTSLQQCPSCLNGT